jgi:DNA-binding CsgD family transcriptional regulator
MSLVSEQTKRNKKCEYDHYEYIPPKMKAIINDVCNKNDISLEEIKSNKLFRKFIPAIKEITIKCLEANYSMARIARALNRSRKTLYYHIGIYSNNRNLFPKDRDKGIWQKHREGLKNKEIAVLFDITESTVRWSLWLMRQYEGAGNQEL